MDTYRVVLTGNINTGFTAEQVKTGLAQIFDLDLKSPADQVKITKLLSNKPVVVKAGLELAEAETYQQAITEVGAETQVSKDPKGMFIAPGVKERRNGPRRKRGDRRNVRRSSAIVPDRRHNRGRRARDEDD